MQGILVIAHGSSNSEWVEMVDQAVIRVDIDLPMVTSFLEMVEGRSIQEGIDQLEKMGVTHIIAVPLFVSKGSTHIQEIRYLLGLEQEIPLEVDDEPLVIHAEISLAPPMDDHSLILQIVEKRVQELSSLPEEEVVLLVGHGSKLDDFYTIWVEMMERMARHLQQLIGFKQVAYATLLPDQLAEQLKKYASAPTILVPLFLSEGYFTKKVIPSRMEGIDCRYSGKTYLPDPLVSEWIKAVVLEMSVVG